MRKKRKIILASKSPRRKKLLEQIGIKAKIIESGYKEDMEAISDPHKLAKFLAMEKALEVAKNFKDAVVIGADTLVVFEGAVMGKPKDKSDARRMLKNFSGREHKVISGFSIIDTASTSSVSDCGEATVRFRDLTEKEIDAYLAREDMLDLAGGYNVMARAAVLIDSIEGDFYSVAGLPISKVYFELRKMGAI